MTAPRRPAGAAPQRPAGVTNNLKAMLWMLAAAALFSGMSAFVKLAAIGLPLGVVLLVRMFLSTVPLTPWLVRDGLGVLRSQRMGLLFLRAALGYLSFGTFTFALTKLALADVIALSFTRPLWVIVVAAILLGEVVGMRRGAATVVGFLGVVIMVRPEAGIDPAMLIALAYALFGSITLTTVKVLARTESPGRIVFYHNFYGFLFSIVPAALDWQTPSPAAALWLLIAGLCATSSQLCVARAAGLGETTVIAPIDFTKLPASALIGYLLFAEVLSLWTIAGAAVILASTLYIARWEARLKRQRSVELP